MTHGAIRRKAKLIAGAWLALQGLLIALPLVASAQYAQPLGYSNGGYADPNNGYTTPRVPLIPGASSTPPYQQAPEGAPPPVGDGSTPREVTPGDTGAPVPPPPGAADMTNGNIFPAGTGTSHTIIYIFNEGKQGRGSRMVQTIRPDTLTPDQKSQIGGILGVNMDSSEAAVNVTASESQLEQIQNILFPYPGAETVDGKKKITSDSPAPNHGINKPGNESIYDFDGPLPTVRTFSRYLVILGVVAATVWMAMAAWGIVCGNPYAGSRAVGAAAGLMLLLGAYTIWKIVQMNTFKANSNTPAVASQKAGGANVSDAYMKGASVPVTPNGGRTTPTRYGIPLEPLGGSVNR